MNDRLIGIDLDGDRLTAVAASVGKSAVTVESWLAVARPDGLDTRDADATGAWIKSEFAKAGWTKGRLVIAVPRGDVILKRLPIPSAGVASDDDLAGAVRLQMLRQLTVSLEGTAIDYSTSAPPGPGGGDLVVMAAALPGDRFAWLKGVARGIGMGIACMGLRSAGIAALLADASQRRSGPILGISPGWGSTEFVVVEEGDRSMVADRGANAGLAPGDLPPALEAGAVLVSGYLLLQEPTTPTGLAAIARSASSHVAVEASSWPLVEAFGPARFLGETVRAGAGAILANDREAEVLTGLRGTAAARRLGERFRVACVKRGTEGATMSFEGTIVEAPAEPVIEVDATGAGDAFDGVLLAALARGEQPEDALRRACPAGALAAAGPGTWPPERSR